MSTWVWLLILALAAGLPAAILRAMRNWLANRSIDVARALIQWDR